LQARRCNIPSDFGKLVRQFACLVDKRLPVVTLGFEIAFLGSHRGKHLRRRSEFQNECSPSIKECKVHTDTYVTVDKDELENIAIERTRTIDIDEFIPEASRDQNF
jgi:hypothetical protein